MNRELVFLRTFAVAAACGMIFIFTSAFTKRGNQKFGEIDVERINVIEKDGTVKMILTNVDRFPNGKTKVNGLVVNEDRKKRSGMLLFNEEGIECGGFIYDGKKTKDGHSSGLSLTYDQYDGDQVMQLLTQDVGKGDQRFVGSTLAFNDRPAKESQGKTMELVKELDEIEKKDPEKARQKYREYEAKGLLGGVTRVMLGKSRSLNNGLFLFDDKGSPKAMFYVDKNNQAKLDFYDDQGRVIASFPEKK